MCSTGGGNSFFESLLDVAISLPSFGFAGYKSDEGGLTTGYSTNAIVNTGKELTGAKAAEEANDLARQEIQNAKDQALTDRENAQASNAADQLSKSRKAGNLRKTTGKSSTPGASSINSNLGQDERDFLGL